MQCDEANHIKEPAKKGVDEERVAHFKSLLAKGAYKVPAYRIAERLSFALLDSDMVTPHSSEGE